MDPKTPKGGESPANPPASTPEAPATTTALQAAENTLLAGYRPPVGVAAGVDFLRKEFDEGAHVLWTTKGAKGGRVAEISGVLVEVEGIRRVVEIHGYETGGFKLFGEVPGKTPEEQAIALRGFYTAG